MEVLRSDLKELKLSPTLIVFLKAIYARDNKYLNELSKIIDLDKVAKYLEKAMIIKVINNEMSYKSFELRNLEIINYLNKAKVEELPEAKEIFNHFISTTEKYSRKKSRLKFSTSSKFLKGRVNQGVDVETAKEIIEMKFDEWWGTAFQHHLNFQTLLGVTHYNQYVQQLDLKEADPEEDLSLEKA